MKVEALSGYEKRKKRKKKEGKTRKSRKGKNWNLVKKLYSILQKNVLY